MWYLSSHILITEVIVLKAVTAFFILGSQEGESSQRPKHPKLYWFLSLKWSGIVSPPDVYESLCVRSGQWWIRLSVLALRVSKVLLKAYTEEISIMSIKCAKEVYLV